ncbi:peroxisomal membrane protein 11A isoform X2 [Paroedura picta]
MLLSYVLENKSGREEMVMKLKHLESSMSSGRKLFRLGNMVHALVIARQSNQLPELVPRFCLTVSNLNRALYFVCDMLLWVKSVGLVPNIDKKKWRNRATRCYYYSLVMNLAEDLYQLCRCMEQTVQTEKAQKDLSCGLRVRRFISHLTGGLQPFLFLLCLTLRRHPPLLLDTLKNLCDLSSPLDRLGIYKTNPGVIGLCGIISSVVGILTIASPDLKLKH